MQVNFANPMAIIVGIGAVLALVTLATYGARGSILKATNEVLEGALETERNERTTNEGRCREQVAELSGQVKTLTRDHARTVAHEVIRVFREEGVLPGGRGL